MNEVFIGIETEQHFIRENLNRLRRDHAIFASAAHPHEQLITLKSLLENSHYHSMVDPDLFLKGTALACERLATLGAYHPFPFDRVWVGIAAKVDHPSAFGGFFHVDQGYRYLQMTMFLSILGSLRHQQEPGLSRELRTAALLKGYIHDTCHANTFRSYQITPDKRGYYRYQYGINRRMPDGTSYSDRDDPKSQTTRNLGIIMEACTDRFAQEVVREVVTQCPEASTTSTTPWIPFLWEDCIGPITQEGVRQLRQYLKEHENTLDAGLLAYFKMQRQFWRNVSLRYEHFLRDILPNDPSALHGYILHTMLSGDIAALDAYLSTCLVTPDAFRKLFQSASYAEPLSSHVLK